MRAVALIDGEHYAPVVRDALGEIPHEIVGALLVGGTEKLIGGDEYGVPVVRAFDEAIASPSTSRTSPCSVRGSASGSRAGFSRTA